MSASTFTCSSLKSRAESDLALYSPEHGNGMRRFLPGQDLVIRTISCMTGKARSLSADHDLGAARGACDLLDPAEVAFEHASFMLEDSERSFGTH